MKTLRQWILVAVAAAFGMGSGNALAAGEIVIGVPNWAYAKVIANVIKVIVEENYAVEVEFVPGNHPVFFKAMDGGKGEVDIHPDVWLPNQQSFIDKYVTTNGTVILTEPKFDAKQGFCTTRHAKDTYGLASVYDLAKPEIVRLTDTDGDGKGEMWMGAPGWTSTNFDKVRARDYGFADLYELTTTEETLVLSQIDSAAKADKVVVWACYSPHHIFGMHELIYLEEPTHDPTKWNPIQPGDDPNWYENSSAATSWPPTTSQMAYSKRLLTDAPPVAKLIDNIEFDTQLINDWSYAVSVEKRDPEEFAREWVAANQDRVNGWLGL